MASQPSKILVLGGTGAQGKNVVRELVRDGRYAVTVLTRDIESASARELKELGNVEILKGSYETEAGLRVALKGQYGVYLNLDSFRMTEAAEYFWTFRLYEIAVQSGVKHLVYPGGANRQQLHRYAEEYRNSHQLTASKMGQWISTQPLELMGWTIICGAVYTEMLSVFFRPKVLDDGTHIFAAPLGDGCVGFAELAAYGYYARWIFDHPERTLGKHIALPTYPTTLEGIATAFSRVTGKRAVAVDVTQEQWFAAASAYVEPDVKQPAHIPAGENDDMRFTFRQSFGAWWNVWKALRPEEEELKPGLELADEIYPDRIRSVEEWMRATGYTGEAKAEMKADKDRSRTF
ncbi:hypothetical protein B0H10DRAFT_1293594 [Mycena sp. CBHHK59/15]|nr:hypothetical protein B0H10DRAFT_1293594 [Mycena sp. CBHHK59/15]